MLIHIMKFADSAKPPPSTLDPTIPFFGKKTSKKQKKNTGRGIQFFFLPGGKKNTVIFRSPGYDLSAGSVSQSARPARAHRLPLAGRPSTGGPTAAPVYQAAAAAAAAGGACAAAAETNGAGPPGVRGGAGS